MKIFTTTFFLVTAIILFVWGAVITFGSSSVSVFGGEQRSFSSLVVGVPHFGFALFYAYIAYAIQRRKKHARILTLVGSLAAVILRVPVLMIGAPLLILLDRFALATDTASSILFISIILMFFLIFLYTLLRKNFLNFTDALESVK